MTVLSQVHFSPWFTIPPALVVGLVLSLYWRRLGQRDVAHSRRTIRRFSLVLMLVLLPVLVSALSFRDPQVNRDTYMYSWLLALGILVAIIVTAAADALNSVRLHGSHLEDEMESAAAQFRKAIGHPDLRDGPAADARPMQADQDARP